MTHSLCTRAVSRINLILLYEESLRNKLTRAIVAVR